MTISLCRTVFYEIRWFYVSGAHVCTDIFSDLFIPEASIICLHFHDSTAIVHVSALEEAVTIHVISTQVSWRPAMATAQRLSQLHNRMRLLCLVLYVAPECSYMFIHNLSFPNPFSESLSFFFLYVGSLYLYPCHGLSYLAFRSLFPIYVKVEYRKSLSSG
jgi:hypothetical protein